MQTSEVDFARLHDNPVVPTGLQHLLRYMSKKLNLQSAYFSLSPTMNWTRQDRFQHGSEMPLFVLDIGKVQPSLN